MLQRIKYIKGEPDIRRCGLGRRRTANGGKQDAAGGHRIF